MGCVGKFSNSDEDRSKRKAKADTDVNNLLAFKKAMTHSWY